MMARKRTARKRSTTKKRSTSTRRRRKSGGKWISGAIKKKGALRKTAGVKKGQKIPQKKLQSMAKKGGKTGQRARLAITLRKMNRKRRRR
jgi:hypothetical protein